MSWGHATSRDLAHWKEERVALPEEKGVMIFTGSTVVDTNNTSGFCIKQKPCLVAVHTGHTMKTAAKPALQQATMIGWMNNWEYANDVPTKPWRGQMTAPRALSLKTYPEGIRLVQHPVDTLSQLREKRFTYEELKTVRGQMLEVTSTMFDRREEGVSAYQSWIRNSAG